MCSLGLKGNSRPKHMNPQLTPFAISTYLVDIIFAKVVCISIPGALPELPSQEDKAGGQLTPIISWGRGRPWSPPGMEIQTALTKNYDYPTR